MNDTPPLTPLFQPLRLRDMVVKNRVVMSPMLMYMAGDDGRVTDLHFVHYGARMLGGIGAVMLEVVAVEPRGRISHRDLGLWEDAQIAGLKHLVDFAHACDCRIGLQLAHAGRKAALNMPIVAPSALAYGPDSTVPLAMKADDIAQLVDAYHAATLRAAEAGFDFIEVHAAHGYLLHEFLAPIANQRDDDFGGDLPQRARLPLTVVETVRAAWPAERPLSVRLSATDHVPDGVTPEDALWFAQALRARHVDLLDVSAGNIVPGHARPVYPGYQLRYAEQFKRQIGLATATTGSVASPDLLEEALGTERIDLAFVGRALLRNPMWLLDAARRAGVSLELPIPTYARASGPYQRGF